MNVLAKYKYIEKLVIYDPKLIIVYIYSQTNLTTTILFH